MKTCDICKQEIKEGENIIHKYGYTFHKEKCWDEFKKGLRKIRKGLEI